MQKSLGGFPISHYSKAKWWRSQLNGLIGYSAAFVGPSKTFFKQLEIIGNAGARFVANLPRRYLVGSMLEHVQSEHKICARRICAEFIVRRMAHCFRHPETPLFSFLSLSVNERLTSLRLVGRRSEVSDSQMERFSFLQNLGIGGDPPVGGFPLVRGQTGCVIRWGAGWFEEVRDQLGWRVRKHDKPELNKRADVLMDLFKRHRVTVTLDAICNAPLALMDV